MAVSHFLFSQWCFEDYDSLFNIDWLLSSEADWLVDMLFIKFPVAFEEFQNSEQFQDIILALVKSSSATAFKMEPINFFFFF